MSFDAEVYREAVEYGLASFYLGTGLYGIDIRLVREINPHLDITPARRTDSFVKGLVNLRGQIVTVIDLSERLGLGMCELGPKSRLVILKTNAELAALEKCGLASCEDKVGLLIDRISDVINPSADQFEPPPPNLNDQGSVYLSGVCKTETTTISVLDVRRLLTHGSEPVEN